MRAFARTAKTAEHNPAHLFAPGQCAPENKPAQRISIFSYPIIYKKAACACGGGCPACQAKSNDLKVSHPNDPAEIEADQVADRVMRMPVDAPVKVNDHRSSEPEKPHTKCSDCEEEAVKETLQRKEGNVAADPPPDAGMDSVKRAVNSGGSPLNRESRSFFEHRLDTDLGHVRIHTDPTAGQSARSINARAYTVGHDVVFGAGQFSPTSDQGRRLIAHELAHVIQQTAPTVSGSAGPVMTRVATPVLARTVDEWLVGSVNVGALTYTQLLGEIDELNQYLQRQTTSSADTGRIAEALTSLRAELNRRDTAAAGPRTPAARRARRGVRAPAPAGSTEPLPARYPRVLTEMTSVMYADSADMRAEYDLIVQWLARPEISATERRALNAERDNLAPQLNIDRQRVVSERHAERVRTALTPPDPEAVDALANLARTIQGIAGEPGNPNLFYIYHQGERVAISREQAESLRNNLHAQLRSAVQRISGNSTYYWERYHAQAALNREHPIIAGISGWLADVEDPGAALSIRYFRIQGQVAQLRSQVTAGDMVEAALILPDVENNYEQIRSLARAYYEGYIEGAEIAVHRLEFTRDASFAIAGSIAAVVAAPVVAGFVGVGGLGLTGASATVATIGGTGVVVGTGMAGVRGSSAAGGVLLAGGTLEEAGSAFSAEARRGFREGFLSGAGGAAARSIGLAIGVGGSLTREVAMRVGGEMLINGTTTMADVLLRGGTVEQAAHAAVIAAAQAVPGALLGGSNNPVVRNLVAPFTAAATSYLASRANGASSEDALAQAGVALASNIAMTRAAHGSDADAALVERGRSMGASTRSTVASAARTARSYTAAAMIGVADALPPLRSGYGGASVVLDTGSPGIASTGTLPIAPAIDTHSTAAPTARVDSTGTAARADAGVAPLPVTATRTETPAPDVTPPATAAPAATRPTVETDAAPPVAATTAAAVDTTVAAPRPAAPADTEAMAAELTSELGLAAPTPVAPTGTRAQQIAGAHSDAVAAGWVDAAGDPVPGGPVHAVVGEHGDASDRRAATGHTGSTRESAHIGATSLLRTLLGYSRRMAMTVLLPRAQHQAFDHHWMRWISNRRRAIRAFGSSDFTAPLSDVLDAQRQALRQTPGLSAETRSTLEGMLEREFHDFAAGSPDGMNTRVPLPAVWGS
jgi:hypothetical protein